MERKPAKYFVGTGSKVYYYCVGSSALAKLYSLRMSGEEYYHAFLLDKDGIVVAQLAYYWRPLKHIPGYDQLPNPKDFKQNFKRRNKVDND